MTDIAERIAALDPKRRALLLQKLKQNSGSSAPPPITRVKGRPSVLPLSFAQQSLWLLDQLSPGLAAYNIPTQVRLEGELKVGVLQRALDEIVRRHESLRTTFASRSGQPFQLVHPPAPVPLSLTDLSSLPPAEREAEARRLAAAEAHRPFDLSTGPLLRAGLLRLGEKEHVALLTMHHIVSDGWSSGVLVRELMALYEAYGRGEESPLAELEIQYADYAVWQREWLQGEVLERELGYWKQMLSGAPPVLELPTDRPCSAVQTYRGASVPVVLGERISETLDALCRREGVTLFMALLAAFDVLLYRYSGQPDIVVGTPIAGRNRAELEPLIGFFVNTLALRTRVNGRETFAELLGQVREVTLGAYQHQEVPFEKLVEELEPERSMSHAPLFQVMLVLQNAPRERLELSQVKSHSLAVEYDAAKYDLTLTAANPERSITMALEYSADLYDRETAARMLRHLEVLLEAAAANPVRRISELPLLTEPEREQLLISWNETARAYPPNESIHGLFEAQARKTPEAVAIVYGRESLTYAELNRRANRLAHHLLSLGTTPGTRIGVYMERSLDAVVALLGALKAGAAYVPLEVMYTPERIADMIEDAQLKVLLTTQSLRHTLPESATHVVCMDGKRETIHAESDTNLDLPVEPGTLAYVIYTSGSTGNPKGVLGLHSATLNRFRWMWEAYPFEAGEVCCQKTALSFVDSVWELFGPLLKGVRAVIIRDEEVRDARSLVDVLAREGVGRIVVVPSLLQAILDSCDDLRQRLHALNLWVTSGEALRLDTARRFLQSMPGSLLLNLYGSSEVSADSTYYEVQDEATLQSVPIGRPIANTEVYIFGDDYDPVPVGVAGELYVGGDGLSLGYHNRPRLTAERFIPHPYSRIPGARLFRTGDLASYLPGGDIEYLGRADHQVKIRGYRIELGEIESMLSERPDVKDCVVVARPHRDASRLVAYVVPHEHGGAPSVAELREHLRRRLPEYMLPAAYVFLEAMPLTPGGKVDRRALPEPEPSAREAGDEFVAPRTPVEATLAKFFSGLLSVEQVSVGDNFFDLGGHSLLGTRLMSRIREAFHVELSLHSLFEKPTIAGLAEHIESEIAEGGGAQPMPDERVGRGGEPLPLSFAQQRLWFIDQMEPGSHVYNMPVAIRLRGRLDRASLERTLREIVRRHESLRTTFALSGEEPVQIIHPSPAFTLPVEDLSHLPREEREAQARRLAAEEAQRPFDLSRGPLLRMRLLRLGEEEHTALLTMHHIVSDGWSMGVLIKEVSTLYEAYSTGRPSPLEELAIQYADFAHWQRQWLRGEVLEEQLAYWKQALEGVPPVLELPTDRPRPAVQNYRGANERFELSAELTKRLKELSRREGVTLFMALLAAFDVLLYRYSGQPDIVVGTPIAGRNRAELEPLIGFFVNTLALRTRVKGGETFAELLGQVREVTLGAYQHQEVPFEKLVEELEPERSLSHAPLFQVSLVLQNAPGGALELPELTLSNVATQSTTTKFDLTLTMYEAGERLIGTFEYMTSLFDAETIRRMAGHFRTFLDSAIANERQRISELPLLTGEEVEQLLFEFNNTAVEYPSNVTLHGLFEAQAASTPDVVAVIGEDERLTYAQLNSQANRVANYLRGKGVGTESIVGLLMKPSSAMVVGIFGILKTGGAYVPLDVEYPQERLALMIKDAGARVIITRQELMGTVETIRASRSREIEAVCLDSDWPQIALQREEPPQVAVDRLNTAYVLYTSGSTGVPKGVAITHGAITNHMLWMNEQWPLSDSDRVLQKTPASFDASVWEFYAPLLTGAQLVMAGAGGHRDVQYLLEVIEAQRIGVIQTVPTLLHAMLNEPGFGHSCGSLRRWFCGGEPLTAELAERFKRNLPRTQLINLYGPTETTIDATYHVWKETPAGNTVPIGKPIANARAYVLDTHMRPVPVGVMGDLYLGGAGLARGYVNRPGLTAERFVPDPFSEAGGARLYRTGDFARYLKDGEIEFLGRSDHQVKLRGYRIELGEVEATIAEHQGVRECAVVVGEGVGGDQRLIAYIVGSEKLSSRELRDYVRERLPAHMTPSVFALLEKMPLMPNGKLDVRALSALKPEAADFVQAYVAPRDELELQLVWIWEDVLDVRPVGVKESFFDLGGHSLLAVRLMSRIQRATGVRLPLSTLFQRPTVEGLATLLRSKGQVRKASPLVEINGGGSRLPFFCVHPAGGNVYSYAKLSRSLGREQPFYGLQARGLNEGEHAATEVQAMAADYIEALRFVQSDGPYLLGGWSMGGVVAFEMARQLGAQGVEVSLLALFDPGMPLNVAVATTEDDREVIASFAHDLGLQVDRRLLDDGHLLELSEDERLHYLLEQVRQADLLPPDIGLAQLQRLFHVFKTNIRARSAYVPASYAGRVTLFRAAEHYSKSETDIALGWGEFARGGVEVHIVPGNHYSILREPAVHVLAERLGVSLASAQAALA